MQYKSLRHVQVACVVAYGRQKQLSLSFSESSCWATSLSGMSSIIPSSLVQLKLNSLFCFDSSSIRLLRFHVPDHRLPIANLN